MFNFSLRFRSQGVDRVSPPFVFTAFSHAVWERWLFLRVIDLARLAAGFLLPTYHRLGPLAQLIAEKKPAQKARAAQRARPALISYPTRL